MTNKPLVDFMVIGAAKAGTTALHTYCLKHPQIGTAYMKEVHFFDKSENLMHKRFDVEEYHSHFDFSDSSKIYGDFTPDYIYFHESARMIWEYNKHVKLVAILRNPMERAFSHWNMQRQLSEAQETISFSEAIRHERMRCRAYLPLQHGHYSYIDRGFYTEQIRRFQRFFPQEQLLILRYDDFISEQEKTLHQFFNFIGVDPAFYQHQFKVSNYFPYQEKMSSDDFHFLADIFKNEIPALEKLMGWDCSSWLREPQ